MEKKSYLKIAFSPDLEGKDRVIYRLLEIFPGFFAWATFSGVFAASYFYPVGAAFFIIIFDVYWLVKTVFLSFHLRANYKRMQSNIGTDWQEKLSRTRWEHLLHLVLLPMSKEAEEVVSGTIASIEKNIWPKERMILVLSYEERYGAHGGKVAEAMEKKFMDKFPNFFVTIHPKGIEGEIPGKGSNETWAAREIKKIFIDPKNIPYENIIVSSFDIDTQIFPQYFEILAWNFLTATRPIRTSYQPVPVYNNNIWDVPALSRVVASSGTFWQMMQQERPERLTTFSSHSMSFKALVDLDFWQTNMVSDDSRIFWNSLLYYDGDYESIPLSYPVSMDANLAPTF